MSFWSSVVEMFRIDAAPLPEEDRRFVEAAFGLFAQEFSWAPLQRPVVVPTAAYFPRDWRGGDDDELADLFAMLCRAMDVAPERVRVEIFSDDLDPVQRLVPFGESARSGPAGLFIDRSDGDRFVIGVAVSQLEHAGSLVATIAHELAHVHLLGDRRLSVEHPDHERLTDLLVVFFGLGIFTANAAFQFSQWRRGGTQGWATQRLGYLDEPALGHALACYAHVRGESKPRWAEYLAHGIQVYLRRSLRELAAERRRVLPLIGTARGVGTER